MESELYKKIMIATDGSENANKAAISGIEIARLAEAKLYAVNVMPMIPHLSYFGVPIEPPKKVSTDEVNFHKQLEQDGINVLEIVKDMGSKAGVQVETVLLEGHPGSEIINFAEKNEFDLIVMGTLGRTGLDRVIVGSVASDVGRHAKTRVMIVK
ncbi:universal stress protein [Methanolobus psychrotolerans]|uniref:universal stress protein n=1 Tax=Methanolobus psychrotolerans TaxID=1874706 RepID=UPI000B91C936|nr:universal stress protein [Methanolobus psychrotolerans]